MKKLNKVIAFAVSVVMIMCSWSVAVFADGGMISGSEVSAVACETVSVPVSYTGNSGTAYLQFGVRYDAAYIKLTGAQNSGLLKGDMFSLETGMFSWLSTENMTGDGELVSLEFEVLPDTPAGEYPIEIIFNQCLEITEGTDTASVEIGTENAKITVTNDNEAKIYTVTLKDDEKIYEFSKIKENEKVGSMANKKPSNRAMYLKVGLKVIRRSHPKQL